MYEKLFSDKLKMGFGAMYNQEFFGPYLVPLINLNWQINDHWSITGLIPVYAKIKYKVSDRLNVGLSHFGLTTTYRLGEVDYIEDYTLMQHIHDDLYRGKPIAYRDVIEYLHANPEIASINSQRKQKADSLYWEQLSEQLPSSYPS